MTTFDTHSLFTNLSLEETIEICLKRLSGGKRFTRIEFKTLLEFATKDALILFNVIYYEIIDGVAMGSSLGPTLTNVFLCHLVKKCPTKLSPYILNVIWMTLFYYFLPETISINSLGSLTPAIKICHLPTKWKTMRNCHF